jgi:transcriptional regulator with XRE-family HTH domain
MSYGYTARLIQKNKEASGRSLGVKLGRLCIKHDLSVSEVANTLGVSRQAVYNWFTGVNTPKPPLTDLIEELISEL